MTSENITEPIYSAEKSGLVPSHIHSFLTSTSADKTPASSSLKYLNLGLSASTALTVSSSSVPVSSSLTTSITSTLNSTVTPTVSTTIGGTSFINTITPSAVNSLDAFNNETSLGSANYRSSSLTHGPTKLEYSRPTMLNNLTSATATTTVASTLASKDQSSEESKVFSKSRQNYSKVLWPSDDTEGDKLGSLSINSNEAKNNSELSAINSK